MEKVTLAKVEGRVAGAAPGDGGLVMAFGG